MPTTEQLRKKLMNKLKELFQPDLDFYRIMHAKAKQIEAFVNRDLLSIIASAFGQVDGARQAEAQAALDKTVLTATDFGAPDQLLSLATHPCAEDPQTRPLVRTNHETGTEGEAKKVKRPVAAITLVRRTVALPAVDNFCLIFAQFKREFLQSIPDSPQQILRMLTTGDVHHDVVGVPFELDFWRCRKLPPVKDFVQIQVRKDRADHSALRRNAPCCILKGCSKFYSKSMRGRTSSNDVMAHERELNALKCTYFSSIYAPGLSHVEIDI